MWLQKFKTGQDKALVGETESIKEAESIMLLGDGVNCWPHVMCLFHSPLLWYWKKNWPNPGITQRMHFNKGKHMVFLLTLQWHSGPEEGLVWIVRITFLAVSSERYVSWKEKYMYPCIRIFSLCSPVSQVSNGGSDGHWSHSCLTACLRRYFFLCLWKNGLVPSTAQQLGY